MNENDFLDALKEAVYRAKTQSALANKIGISQGTISDYLNGRCSIGNMTVTTLLRIFPNMVVDFFGGKTNQPDIDAMRDELLEIFYSLDSRAKAKLVAMAAANFGEKLRKETKR